jgi:hypothetical protein
MSSHYQGGSRVFCWSYFFVSYQVRRRHKAHAPLCERRARLDNPPHVGGHADSQFASEESPSGMLARSGSYAVKSRLIDDDKQVWLDFEWGELLTHPGYPTC